MQLPNRDPLRRPSLVASVVLAAFVWIGAGCREAEKPRPNVLWISLDSTRRDLLGVYGFSHPEAPGLSPSPNIDRLANEGVLFEEAYSTTSWTLPSHVSLFTGQPELVHGVDVDKHRLDPELSTLPEILHRAGYRTAGFFSGPYLEPEFGFGRGFERYEACYSPALERASDDYAAAEERLREARARGASEAVQRIRDELKRASLVLQMASHQDRSSERVTDRVLEELERALDSGRRFFLFAHYFDPHYDYIPPPPFDTRFDPHYQGDIGGERFLMDPRISVPLAGGEGRRRRVLSERDMARIWALYAGELAWTDQQIGRIVARLDELGLARETLVVVTADHGDEFFEHGYLGHRNNLFEESVRIPLVLRLPGVLPAGERVGELASNTDLFDTTLELARVRPAGESSRSLVALIAPGDSTRAGAAGRAVLGRLVQTFPVDTTGAGGERLAGTAHVVLETFRAGSIKITREARWVRPRGAARAQVQATDPEIRQTLRWIDLAEHPEERDADHSSDFSDERARAALERFDRRYRELVRLRMEPRTEAEQDSQLRERLGALGYAEVELDTSERGTPLVLAPPGESILEGR